MLNIRVVGERGYEFGSSSRRGTMSRWLETVKKKIKQIWFGVFMCLSACVAELAGAEAYIPTQFFGCMCCCLCVTPMSKHLIVRLLLNQLSCMVNKSVLIGSALEHLWYQNLIKSLFQPCLVARTKLCSVAMDTRQVNNYQTWKHRTGLRFPCDYRRHVYSA